MATGSGQAPVTRQREPIIRLLPYLMPYPTFHPHLMQQGIVQYYWTIIRTSKIAHNLSKSLPPIN
jgi:hypothetical protein